MEAKLLVTNDTQHGFKIQSIPVKGRAVVATRSFVKGEFVLEYDGQGDCQQHGEHLLLGC